jgi:8-oxo-dGTP diphosphatase
MIPWDAVPVFGGPPDGGAVVRPSAYAIVTDASARLAIVRTPQGVYLPGGGVEPDESVEEAVVREAREECGLDVRVGAWSTRAVDFVYSLTELTHFEKRSTFVEARVSGPSIDATELGHALEWLAMRDAIAVLAHPSHRWAVSQWAARYSLT